MDKNNRGIALYLTVIILSIILTISLSLAGLLFYQIKMARDIGNSVPAFYAAETGIERAFYEIAASQWLPEISPALHEGVLAENGASYQVWVFAPDLSAPPVPGASCAASRYCIKSIGIFRDIRRGLWVGR